jgi:hypothetical protein
VGRRALTAVTMTVLVALLVVAGLVGWNTLSSSDDTSASGHQGRHKRCAAGLEKGDVVHSSEVRVSVYNAGTRDGLAGRVQDKLAAREFLRGAVSNAPAGFGGVQSVRVLARKANDPAARLVARQFGPRTVVQPTRNDLGPGVDVVIGNQFSGLVDAPQQVRATASGSGC